MIPASSLSIKQSLNKAYRLIKPKRASMEAFKSNLVHLLQGIDEKESEENVKIQLMDFLKNTQYHPDYLVATKGKTDLVIHTGKEAKTPAGVLFEVKRPTNKADMVSRTNLNAKALHELILYYLRERLDGNNTDVRQLVITNIYEWFIFDAQDFERLFGKSTQLKKDYEAWKTGQKVSQNTDHFYREIAKPFLDVLPEELPFTYFNIRDFEKALRNNNQLDDNQLIGLYKILSPVHLLKLPFSNDSNSLDKGFYAELLHLIGLEEVKEGNKKLIQRKAPARRQPGSLLENAILTIESEDRLRKLNPPSAYGATEDERLFTVALELCITWINRILFLKLLEAQLIKYHRGDAHYKFLNYATIPQYDELNKLFFQVLARRPESRTDAIQQKYGHVPYLNSSLFEPTDLEDDIIRVNSLDDMVELDLHTNTVLRDARNKPVATRLNALEYLLRFLDAYDFASEGSEEIQEESKTLINAAVLGLIFEKINGYKDGSIYTPGFITMYMCRQAIRLAVVQKFNDTQNWQAETFDDLKNYLADHRSTTKILEFNALLNSLHLCDPAVGSGHFLVSALNELIAIKAELKLLADSKGVRLAGHEVSIENDELIITNHDTQDIFEYTVSPATGGKGFYIAPETQRVQQTLFHEKQTIIENCLFGVDINPNSVKICRLRLWIELLKNAYYILEPTAPHEANTPTSDGAEQSPLGGGGGRTNDPELQTLPNIDINIKQGNSLLSRFALDTDLKEALKGTKYTVTQYRSFVQEYKNSHNKDRKRELETIINRIKADFRTEIYRTDPKVKRLQKLSGELQILTTQTSIFEPSVKEKKDRQQQVQKLQTDIAGLSAGIDEIKSNAIYRNAFEWRFEFPEVLDNDGNFEGFDVVIGNPPYGVELQNNIKDIFKRVYNTKSGELEIYAFFIELALQSILKKNGILSYITSNTWYYLDKFSDLRKGILENYRIDSLIELEKQVFADAPDIVPSIFIIEKNNKVGEIQLYKSSKTKAQYDLVNFSDFKKSAIKKESYLTASGYIFNLLLDETIDILLRKIASNDHLKTQYKTVYGIKTGDNKANLSQSILDDGNWKKCASSANNIKKFVIDWKGDYLNVGKHLSGLGNVNYEQPKILIQYIRKLSMPTRLVCALDINGEFYPLNNFSFVISENGNSLKSLLGILNSKLINWYFSNTFIDYNIKPKYIEKLPIKFHEILSSQLEENVNQLLVIKQLNLQAETTALEKQIDELVYQLYELKPEEIAIVEGR